MYGRVNRYTDTSDTTTAKAHVNDAYRELVRIGKAKITTVSKTLVAGTGSYTLSGSFSLSDVLEILYITYIPTGSTNLAAPLQPVGYEEILRYRISSTTGYVRCYALVGVDNIELYPAPDAADSISIVYVSAPTALSADGDVPSAVPQEWQNLIAIGATARMMDEEASEDVPTWQARWDQGTARFQAWVKKRSGATPRRSNVGYPSRNPSPSHDPSQYWSDPDW